MGSSENRVPSKNPWLFPEREVYPMFGTNPNHIVGFVSLCAHPYFCQAKSHETSVAGVSFTAHRHLVRFTQSGPINRVAPTSGEDMGNFTCSSKYPRCCIWGLRSNPDREETNLLNCAQLVVY